MLFPPYNWSALLSFKFHAPAESDEPAQDEVVEPHRYTCCFPALDEFVEPHQSRQSARTEAAAAPHSLIRPNASFTHSSYQVANIEPFQE
jgi:hypothetical protein